MNAQNEVSPHEAAVQVHAFVCDIKGLQDSLRTRDAEIRAAMSVWIRKSTPLCRIVDQQVKTLTTLKFKTREVIEDGHFAATPHASYILEILHQHGQSWSKVAAGIHQVQDFLLRCRAEDTLESFIRYTEARLPTLLLELEEGAKRLVGQVETNNGSSIQPT